MTDVVKELREYLDNGPHTTYEPYEIADEAITALEAVLEIHQRMEQGVRHYGLQEHPDWCSACSEPETGISAPYPCPTVRAIIEHLGGQE